MCEPSSGVVGELLVLLLPNEPEFDPALGPTRRSRLAEHALHPDVVAGRLGSKRRPRAARAEAARAGRWWPWLDSNGVIFFVQHTIGVPAVDYSGSSTSCCCINTWYLVRGTCGLRIIRKNEMRSKLE